MDILYPLRRLHGQLHEAAVRRKLKREYILPFLEMRKKNPNTVFLVLTPEHGNTGDHAIAQAEAKLLSACGISYYEVSTDQLDQWRWQGVLDIMNGYPILINGGGNLGTLWPHIEALQREVVRQNPKSPIAILPNTIFYENSDWGMDEFEKSKKIYNRHNNLVIYAREKISYEFMRNAYRNVKLVPDMVLSLNYHSNNIDRFGCLLCLRSDLEKALTNEQANMIRKQAENMFGEAVFDTDMNIGVPVSIEERDSVLQNKFEEFSHAELVITDRLHGMIFCAVTQTPCIVVDSISPKLRGCYEWIRNLEYIKFVNDVAHILDAYKTIPKKDHTFDNSHFVHYYEGLAKDIKKML